MAWGALSKIVGGRQGRPTSTLIRSGVSLVEAGCSRSGVAVAADAYGGVLCSGSGATGCAAPGAASRPASTSDDSKSGTLTCCSAAAGWCTACGCIIGCCACGCW